MAKQKKSRKHKKYTPKKDIKPSINEMLPPGHRFDKEIADTCSTVMLRVQMKRLDQPVAVEREIRKELKALIAQRKLSRVATDFFDSIIDICERQPFVKAATRLLDATYKEYVTVEKHMATLEEVSMHQRILNLIEELKGKGWHIELLYEDGQPMPDEPFHFFSIHKNWEQKMNEDGRLMETMSIAVRTENMGELTEMAYQHGLLLHRVAFKHVYFHLKIHPDNNIPGIPLSPPSIQIEK